MRVHVSYLVSVGVFNVQRAQLVNNKGEGRGDTKAFEKMFGLLTEIQQGRASLLSLAHLIHPLPVRIPSSVIMRLGVD